MAQIPKPHISGRSATNFLRAFYARALNFRTLVGAGILVVFVLLALSPLSTTLPFRSFFASLTQDLIIARVNPQRTIAGVTPLTVNPLLQQAARMKAEDMLARGYFSHLGPSGELPWVWFDRVGYHYAAAGENLAIDFSDPDALVSAWMASPTHAANIRNGVFTDIGIGIAEGNFQGRQTDIVVMFLGRKLVTTVAQVQTPPPAPAPTPAPAPAPAPKPTPAPQPQPPPQPAPQPAPEPTPIEPIATTPLSAPMTAPESVPQDFLMTDTPQVGTPATTPSATQAVAAKMLTYAAAKGPIVVRFGLSVFFLASLISSIVMYAMPALRPAVNLAHSGAALFMLALMWLPNVL